MLKIKIDRYDILKLCVPYGTWILLEISIWHMLVFESRSSRFSLLSDLRQWYDVRYLFGKIRENGYYISKFNSNLFYLCFCQTDINHVTVSLMWSHSWGRRGLWICILGNWFANEGIWILYLLVAKNFRQNCDKVRKRVMFRELREIESSKLENSCHERHQLLVFFDNFKWTRWFIIELVFFILFLLVLLVF
jgi:hypothetical protein